MYNIASCKMNILVINYIQKERYQTKGKTQQEKPKQTAGTQERASAATWDNSKKRKPERMVKLNQVPKANSVCRTNEVLLSRTTKLGERVRPKSTKSKKQFNEG